MDRLISTGLLVLIFLNCVYTISHGATPVEYKWKRIFGEQHVKEKAFVEDNINQEKSILFKAESKKHRDSGFDPAQMVYSYSLHDNILAIRDGRQGPCFIIDLDLPFSELINYLTFVNGETVETTNIKNVVKTNVLTNKQAKDLLDDHPRIARLCKRHRGLIKGNVTSSVGLMGELSSGSKLPEITPGVKIEGGLFSGISGLKIGGNLLDMPVDAENSPVGLYQGSPRMMKRFVAIDRYVRILTQD